MASDTELAWAAGIIDGEGCIAAAAHRVEGEVRFYSILLKVTMGHLPTVERLHSILGVGTIQKVNQRRWNPAWSVLCTTRQAEKAIDLVYPHLVTKRAEADLAREFFALPIRPGQRMTPEIAARKLAIWTAMRDIKPSARFRTGK